MESWHERTCIVSKVFIDTNLFVYSIDKKEPEKQNRARALLKKIIGAHQPVISTQVVEEFYVVATTRLLADKFIVKNIIHNLRHMEIVNNDLELMGQAIDISILSHLPFWDALIIAAAEKANCEFLYSENFESRQSYRGILVLNPFEEDHL